MLFMVMLPIMIIGGVLRLLTWPFRLLFRPWRYGLWRQIGVRIALRLGRAALAPEGCFREVVGCGSCHDPLPTRLFVLFALVAAGWSPAPDARQRPDPPPYRILVTNDDGVQSPGLAAVAQILQAIGTVSIVAPAEQQSSAGHGLVTRDPIYRQDLTLPNGMRAIGLTATPASVVRVAMRMIMQPRPDLVVSGINRGYNLGYSGYVSGTLAAARDAAMFGVPAVAASMRRTTPRPATTSRPPRRCWAWRGASSNSGSRLGRS